MLEISYLLVSGAVFFLLVSGLVLWLRPSGQAFCRRLLGTAFMILAWYIFIFLLVFSGFIIKYPYFFRVGCPFYYLVPPLFYLYVRCRNLCVQGFRKGDWLHFIPFALACADVFPYVFLTDTAVKLAELRQFMQQPMSVVNIGSGLLPAGIHYYMRLVICTVYLVMQWCLLLRRHKGIKLLLREDSISFFLTVPLSVMYLGNVVITLTALGHKASWFVFPTGNMVYDMAALAMVGALILLCLYVFYKPAVLYDLAKRPAVIMEPAAIRTTGEQILPYRVQKEVKTALSDEFLAHFIPRLEQYMECSEAFRKKGLNIHGIALELDVAPHVLSAVLNNYYGQRFNDYVNKYRIRYVLERLKSGDCLKTLSIEGLAAEAGFSSRTPFYTAFKKITGFTPSAWIKEMGV